MTIQKNSKQDEEAIQAIFNVLHGKPKLLELAVAQFCSEGKGSGLSKTCYNMFGVKGHGPAGSVTLQTREWGDEGEYYTAAKFKKFHSYEEAVASWLHNIEHNPAYKKVASANNFQEAARAMAKSPWATADDREYLRSLLSTHEKFFGKNPALVWQKYTFPDRQFNVAASENCINETGAGKTPSTPDGIGYSDILLSEVVGKDGKKLSPSSFPKLQYAEVGNEKYGQLNNSSTAKGKIIVALNDVDPPIR